MCYQINIETKKTDQLQEQLISLKKQLKNNYQNIQKQKKAYKDFNQDQLIKSIKQQENIVGIFKALHSSISTKLMLMRIIIKKHQVNLHGRSDSIFAIMRITKSFIKYLPNFKPVMQKISHKDNEYDFVLDFNFV